MDAILKSIPPAFPFHAFPLTLTGDSGFHNAHWLALNEASPPPPAPDNCCPQCVLNAVLVRDLRLSGFRAKLFDGTSCCVL